MNKIQLTTRNVISFRRVDTKSCIGYEIYAIYSDNGEQKEYLLDVIENPKTPSPFRKIKNLQYNEKEVWEFEERIMAKTSNDVTVYVNEIRLNSSQYTFSSALGLLNIHIKLKDSDNIRIEYYVDRIEYIHNATQKHAYRVVPVFDKEYKLGDHSLLNHQKEI